MRCARHALVATCSARSPTPPASSPRRATTRRIWGSGVWPLQNQKQRRRISSRIRCNVGARWCAAAARPRPRRTTRSRRGLPSGPSSPIAGSSGRCTRPARGQPTAPLQLALLGRGAVVAARPSRPRAVSTSGGAAAWLGGSATRLIRKTHVVVQCGAPAP
jgi:hypothetical protein